MRTELETGFVTVGAGRGCIRVHESVLKVLGFDPKFSKGLTMDRLFNRAFERGIDVKIGAVVSTEDGEAGTCTVRLDKAA